MTLSIVDRHDHELAARLRSLTAIKPPAETLARLQALAESGRGRPDWSRRVAGVAAAAVALIAAIIYVPDGQPPERVATATDPASSVQPDVDSLMAQSLYLDHLLASLPSERRVQRVGTASTISALEDQVALIDSELGVSDAAAGEVRTAALWRQRVGLMSSLVTLRGASAIPPEQDSQPLWL